MPETEFTLRIKLGNAAMQRPADVADLLHELSFRLAQGEREVEGILRDLNGATVGRWSASWPEPEEEEE